MSGRADEDGLERLKRMVAGLRQHRLTVLTGAGISTESGVPDFRSPDTPWRRYPPIPFKDFVASPALRAEAWRRKFAMDDIYRGARANRGHQALAAMAERGLVRAVITQNIDGLHQAAGLPLDRLIELHGNGTFARCLRCGTRIELASVRAHLDRTGEAPICSCGGLIKSATIAFGQAISPEVIADALAATGDCDVFVAIGSSLAVRPASRLPLLAKESGAALVIINREATPLDEFADLVIRGEAGEILSEVAGRH